VDRRDAAPHRAAAGSIAGVEARERDVDGGLVAAIHAQHRVQVPQTQVPAALALVAVAEPDRAVRDRRRAGDGVQHDGLPVGVLARVADVGGHQEPPRDMRAVALVERDQQRQVGEPLAVVAEALDLALDPELLEQHVAHRHRERGVGPGLRGQPVVGELHVVGVVR
jgi:hypothetical protein